MFLNGHSVDTSAERFKRLAKRAFQRRGVWKASLLSRMVQCLPYFSKGFLPLQSLFHVVDLIMSYLSDGLYQPKHIEAALMEAFGTTKSMLDSSSATTTGTRVGLPVATVDQIPSCQVFTNYNGVGQQADAQGTCKSYLRGG